MWHDCPNDFRHMKENRFVVIMAGGRGERFWPVSRLKRPKHLLPIVGEEPMLTQTVNRLEGLVPPERILIITNREQRQAVLDVCPMLPPGNVVAEPVGRDTAAAVALATILVGDRAPEGCFAMLPADAVIHDRQGFQSVLHAAFEAAESEDALVTVGIQASFPATGYGYIHRGPEGGKAAGRTVYAVRQFREKPDEATATEYVASGEYFWNAGMFIWRVPVIAGEFARHTPQLWQAAGAIREGLAHGQPLEELLEQHYPALEKISVDYAIMEKAAKVHMVESDFDWDDVGEWPAIERHFPKDAQGNVIRGKAAIKNGAGNIVVGDGERTVALIGLDNLIVVQSGDATLICPKSDAQGIKGLVKELANDEQFKHLL